MDRHPVSTGIVIQHSSQHSPMLRKAIAHQPCVFQTYFTLYQRQAFAMTSQTHPQTTDLYQKASHTVHISKPLPFFPSSAQAFPNKYTVRNLQICRHIGKRKVPETINQRQQAGFSISSDLFIRGARQICSMARTTPGRGFNNVLSAAEWLFD